VEENLRTPPKSPLRINKIRLIGCKQIPRRVVRSILRQQKTPWYTIRLKEGGYDPFWAEDDRERIEKFYRSRGFYSVEAAEPEVELGRRGRGVSITYRIREGPPVNVLKINIIFEDGVHEEDDPQTMRKLVGYKEGDRFELEPYQVAGEAMEIHYKDDAFYRAIVTRRAVVDLETDTSEVTYRITKGAR